MSGSTLPDRELKESKYIRVFKEGDYIVHNRTDSGTGVKDKKPVDVYCYKTREYILTCDSVAEASIIYNVKHQNICACCSGIKGSSYVKQYIFRWKGDDLGLHPIGEYKGDMSPKVIRITDTNNGEVFLFKSKREAGRYFEAGHSSFSHPLLTGGLWKNKYKIELIDK